MEDASHNRNAAIQGLSYNSGADYFTPSGWKSEVLDYARVFAELARTPLAFDWIVNGNLQIQTRRTKSPENLFLEKIFSRRDSFYHGSFISTTPTNLGVTDTMEILANNYVEPKQIAFDFAVNINEIISSLHLDQSFVASYAGQQLFVPSAGLCNIWADGINHYINDSKFAEKLSENFEDLSEESLRSEFASKFQRMIATIASARSREGITALDLSDGSQLTLDWQHEVLDRFFVEPSRQSSFIFQLHSELKDYLAGNGAIQGKWGKVVLICDRMQIRLEKVSASKLPTRQAMI